jgi:hypothetical protein
MGTGFVKEEIVATSNVFLMKELDPMEDAFIVGATISSVTEFQVPPVFPRIVWILLILEASIGANDKEERLHRQTRPLCMHRKPVIFN